MYQKKKGLPHTGSSLLRHYTCIIAGSLGWWMLDGRAVANFVWLVYRGKIQTEDNLRREAREGEWAVSVMFRGRVNGSFVVQVSTSYVSVWAVDQGCNEVGAHSVRCKKFH
jgi:hypothetical protein